MFFLRVVLIFSIYYANAYSIPLVESVSTPGLNSTLMNHSVKLLVDENDSDHFYVVPSKINLEKEDGNPLFRMVIDDAGYGHILMMVRIQPATGFERVLSEIKRANPNARFSMLPISSGKLTVNLMESSFNYRIIAESSEFSNANLNVALPFHAKISPEGVDILTLHASTRNGSLLSLGFDFSFIAKEISKNYDFKIHKDNFLRHIRDNDHFLESIRKGNNLDGDWVRQMIIQSIGFNFDGGKSVIPLQDINSDPQFILKAAAALSPLMPKIFWQQPPKNWLFYPHLLYLDQLQDSSEIIELSTKRGTQTSLQRAQLGSHLKGACLKYSHLFFNYSNEGMGCEELVPGGGGEEPPVCDPILGCAPVDPICDPLLGCFDPIAAGSFF